MANIYVGVLIARLETSWVTSLKEKRSVIMPITEKLKQRFPVSVARVDGTEEHGWEVIAVSGISHDKVWLEGVLNKVADFVAASPCTVVAESLDIEIWADSTEII